MTPDAHEEARLYAESIVNSVREPLLVLDADQRVRSINRAFTTMFGLRSRDVTGRSLREIGAGIWNSSDLLTLVDAVIESGEPMEGYEHLFDTDELRSKKLVVSARRVRRNAGRQKLVLVSVDDVTERRRIEALLQENEEQRRETERLRQRQLEITNALRVSTVGELAAGLAHELNQPLSSILNTTEACKRYVKAGRIDPPKLLSLLTQVASQSMRAAGIVAHLRSFVEKGEPQLKVVDLAEMVRHAPHLLLREFRDANVKFSVQVRDSPLPVRADGIQIEQVLVNLLQNAIDSIQEADSSKRRVDLSVGSVGGSAEVSVSDTGAGVGDSVAHRLFQPFFTTKPQGLGMGLALSRSILEAHKGRIWIEPRPDGEPGAVVRFSIPLKGSRKRTREKSR